MIREDPGTIALNSTFAREERRNAHELILQLSQDTSMTLGTRSDLENGTETPVSLTNDDSDAKNYL